MTTNNRAVSYAIRGCLIAATHLYGAESLVVTPNNESVQVGLTRQFTATVSGLASSTVMWSVNGVVGGDPMGGTITPAGLFTAPVMVPPLGTSTIAAVSTMDPTVMGNAIAQVKNAGPTLTSLAPAIVPAGTINITINGSGFLNGAASWLNGIQMTTTFVSGTQLKASATVSTTGSMLLRVINPASVFSAPITLNITTPGTALSISPASTAIPQGLTQSFVATLNGSPATVTWSVNGAVGGNANVGTITSTGLFTAPALIPNPPLLTVSAAGANSTPANASVTVVSNQPPTLTAATPAPVPLGVFSLTVNGAGFVSGSQVKLGVVTLSTQYVSPNLLIASGLATQNGPQNLLVVNGPIASSPLPVQVGVANPLVTPAAARRFLEQAAFGPTSSLAAHVQQVGIPGYLAEQFAMPPVSNYQGLANQSGMGFRFLANATMNPDQLRQKVAFALSQIFVTSLNKVIWTTTMAPYQEMLLADAFTSYKQLLTDVTLSPSMGYFLDMANNGKANAAGTILPNENYAREVLQLFSVGTVGLNADGTPNGQTNYTQQTITEFARVFTGWTNAPATVGAPVIWGAYMNPSKPLVAYPAQHDTGPKTLLNGLILPAGQSAQKDLADAIDNIVNHPSTGPFICRQLIQHLVISNPSPAYIQRVTQVFNNPQNRGDMPAVIAAILTDIEARQSDVPGLETSTDGHLQEPALFVAGYLRAFNAQVTDANYFSSELVAMGQDIFNAPSVFNYYSPNYQVPGFGVTGGEFQLHTPFTAIYRANQVAGLFSSYQNPVQTYGPGTTMDLTPYVALGPTPALLVDALDLTLMHGQMPAAMKQQLVTAVSGETGGNLRRVQTGIYLILSSGYYNVWH